MTLGNYSGGTVGLSQWDPSFALVARRSPFLRQIVNVKPISKTYAAWAEQRNRDGGAGATAEGSAKTQADFDIVEANKKVEKITSYIKASRESLDDVEFLQSEINNDLMSLVNLKLDADLLSGNGTTPNLKGILEYATAFSAPTGTGNAVDNANTFDALRAALLQVELAYFQPNYIIMHPTDVALCDMIKVGASANEYINAPFGTQFSFRSFYGVPIVANAGMTRGDILVGDFTKSNLGIREDVNISIGYDSDDFTKNLITILAEMRAVHYIKTNHTGAFVKGTISTIKTALETA
jgi:HK97 family phage major capsid protein